MSNDNVSWLTTVPTSDCNFKIHLQSATVGEIHEALHVMTGQGKKGNSTRIAECPKELRRRAKR